MAGTEGPVRFLGGAPHNMNDDDDDDDDDDGWHTVGEATKEEKTGVEVPSHPASSLPRQDEIATRDAGGEGDDDGWNTVGSASGGKAHGEGEGGCEGVVDRGLGSAKADVASSQQQQPQQLNGKRAAQDARLDDAGDGQGAMLGGIEPSKKTKSVEREGGDADRATLKPMDGREGEGGTHGAVPHGDEEAEERVPRPPPIAHGGNIKRFTKKAPQTARGRGGSSGWSRPKGGWQVTTTTMMRERHNSPAPPRPRHVLTHTTPRVQTDLTLVQE
jgi:hypothetical protein